MNLSQHKLETRVCPACGMEKTYPSRQLTCSRECARRYSKTQRTGGANVPLDQRLRDTLSRAKGQLSIRELSEMMDRSERTIIESLERLRAEGLNVHLRTDGQAALSADVKPGSGEPMIIHSMQDYRSGLRVFGATGDNHIGSKHERLDVLHALYDLYAGEGVTEVFNTGNWIEGESRVNYHDIKVFGLDDQIDYFLEHYPQRKGITTYFVAGDDHEGWYQKRERIEIGRYMAVRAERAGRKDLQYLGYVEGDVELRAKRGSRVMKVMHPGGGAAYALSYAPQKIVESFQGGEKPSVLLIGHYHKFDFNYAREVFCVQTGCTCDQSVFMRKLRIQAHVGGCLIRMNQADDGRITRFSAEFVPFYDKGFYIRKAA